MITKRSIDSRLTQVCTPQLGLAHVRQLAAVGVDHHAIRRRIGDGCAYRVFRPVIHWAAPGTILSRDQQELAAILAAGEGARIWRDTAAARLGMWDRPSDRVHVVAPRLVRLTGIVDAAFHRSRHELPRTTRRCGPITVPSPLDALRSCGVSHTPHQLAAMLRSGVYARLFSLDDVVADVVRFAGVPGSNAVRTALALRFAGSAGTKSRSEDRFAAAWERCGFDVPLVNVRGAAGTPDYEPDFAWLSRRVILEIDGDQHTDDPIQRQHDLRRDALLRSQGWIVIRVHWRRVWTHLVEVIDQMRTALASRC